MQDKLAVSANSNWVEASKIENLMQSLQTIYEDESLIDLFSHLIKDINSLIVCQRTNIFIMDKELIEKVMKTTTKEKFSEYIQRIFIDGNMALLVSLSDKDISEPCF